MSVLTWHNQIDRTGANLSESILTPSNVNSASFGKLGFVATDGKPDAQPLYVPNLSIPGQGTHNVAFIATENDSVYAVDADTGAQLWKISALLSGETPSDDRGCSQVTPIIGITATPVIDLSSGPNGTIYFIAMSKDSSGNYHHRLHALDITTGAEQFGGPAEIQATFGGKTFEPGQYKERAALLLLNGVVYTSWASHCDIGSYSSWVMGFDEKTLQKTTVLNLTPNGSEGAIWSAGAGPAVDASGNIYLLTGNGTFDTTLDSSGFPVNANFGNALVKLSLSGTQLQVADYFTMSNTVSESNGDVDLGSGGAMVIPDFQDTQGATHRLVVGAGKDSNLYNADRGNLGKFNASHDQIFQELLGALPGGIYSAPAFYKQTVYYGPVGSNLRAFQLDAATGKLGTAPSSKTSVAFPYPGVIPSLSANGGTNGIVWAYENSSPAVLRAYDASDLGKELYNSNQAASSRDQFGNGNKFMTPTIVGGKVFIGSVTGIGIFGLLH